MGASDGKSRTSRTSRKGKKRWDQAAVWKGFVNTPWTESSRELAKEAVRQQADDLRDSLQELLDQGYTVSLKRDKDNENVYLATWNNQNPEHPSFGYTMTERSRDPWNAFYKGVFALFEVWSLTWKKSDMPDPDMW